MKIAEPKLFSSKLKKLEKELSKLKKAEDYLANEKSKLLKEKDEVRIKIKKEKEILNLKRKIGIVKNRKR